MRTNREVLSSFDHIIQGQRDRDREPETESHSDRVVATEWQKRQKRDTIVTSYHHKLTEVDVS